MTHGWLIDPWILVNCFVVSGWLLVIVRSRRPFKREPHAVFPPPIDPPAPELPVARVVTKSTGQGGWTMPQKREVVTSPQPLDPRHVAHYLAACRVAGVPVAATSERDLPALIERCAALSIPDAVKLLRREAG